MIIDVLAQDKFHDILTIPRTETFFPAMLSSINYFMSNFGPHFTEKNVSDPLSSVVFKTKTG